MNVRRHWLVVSVLLLASVNGFAQITGAIQGQAIDHEGKELPGVTVKLTGDPIPGAERVATTDANGSFKYNALPVGRYSLSASLAGFTAQEVSDVRVMIDGVASVAFRMHPDAFTGEIAVTGEAPLVDTVSTSVTTNYDAEFVESLPTRNNFYDIMSVAPAMSQPNEGNGYFSGYGGNATSEQWNIDGLNLASPEGGWLVWSINPDIVMETSLKGFGAGAEYGSTLGNVYNMVTKSGTNQFHGSVAAYLLNDSLVDPNVELDPEDLWDYRLWDPAGQYTVDEYYDLRATLGGPLVRDKVWFFAAAEFQENDIVDPDGVAGIDGTGTTTHRYDLKITAQPGASHLLTVRGHTATSDIVPAPDMYTELSAVMRNDTDIDMFTGDYTWIMTDQTLLNVRAGTWTRNEKLTSRTGSTEELLQDATYPGPSLYTGGPWWFSSREQDYTQVDAVVSYFADEFIAGSHEFKFGVQYNEGLGERWAKYSSFVWHQPPTPAFYWYDYWAFRFQVDPPFVYGAETTTKAAFVEDSWQISNRLTIDIGVRYDDQNGRIPDFPRLDSDGNPTGETIPGVDMISWQNWAPRLGFAWQPTGDGRSVLRGFAGLYYDGPGSSAWYVPPPGRGAVEVLWVYPWPFLPPVQSTPAPAPDELLAPGVENPSTWQYGLSFDQQLGDNYAIGAQFVIKNTDNIIGWQIEDDGYCEPFQWDDPYTPEVEAIELCETLVEPTLFKGNGPGPGSLAPDANYHIDYKGAILTFRKRYTKGWDLMASYTYSKTEGINARPHDAGALGQGLPMFAADSGSDVNDWYNAEHLLQGDRTHMFRVQSNVDLGWGLRASGVLNLQSGRPYLRLAFINGPVTGRAITITADANEDLRMPSQAILDLGLQKTFNLGGDVGLDIGLQLLNALNEDAAEYFASWLLFPGQDFEDASWVSPRRLQIKLKLAF